MTPEQFVYWLQGFSEITGSTPSEKQWEIIQDHLQLVFEKVTPERIIRNNIPLPALPTAADVNKYQIICSSTSPGLGIGESLYC